MTHTQLDAYRTKRHLTLPETTGLQFAQQRCKKNVNKCDMVGTSGITCGGYVVNLMAMSKPWETYARLGRDSSQLVKSKRFHIYSTVLKRLQGMSLMATYKRGDKLVPTIVSHVTDHFSLLDLSVIATSH
ncbi:unnamed protein product [Sphenostylis stenocarpa]|uniref:Uncharacterized protein n=1 Tax=Sphenostylis stenocarpa TaxID=92480 RepID=A0AA86SFF8_9FABA|nr:unnamed protein product [Sphenostylis stenocarpa]